MADFKLDWNPAPFKKELIKTLVSQAEIVGEFIESDARRRLLAISDPEWGQGYREGVVSRLLVNVVKAKSNEVLVIVGVQKSKSGSHHGFYIELGSSTAPAHPFLRPAVFMNGREIIKLLEGK